MDSLEEKINIELERGECLELITLLDHDIKTCFERGFSIGLQRGIRDKIEKGLNCNKVD